MKFSKPIVREIEIDGDAVIVTMDAHGVTIRPKGARNGECCRGWGWIYRRILTQDAEALRPKKKGTKLVSRSVI